MMHLNYQEALRYIQHYFADDLHLPVALILPDTKLREDLLYDNYSLVELGKYLNRALWGNSYIIPRHIVACVTVKDIAALIVQEQPPGSLRAPLTLGGRLVLEEGQ